MYSTDFDVSFCSESDLLRGLVGSMDTDRAVKMLVEDPNANT
jgi:hypothetical protein